MSETEKKIAETIKKAWPAMSDFDRGYIMGKIEQIAADHPAPKGEPEESREKDRTA